MKDIINFINIKKYNFNKKKCSLTPKYKGVGVFPRIKSFTKSKNKHSNICFEIVYII